MARPKWFKSLRAHVREILSSYKIHPGCKRKQIKLQAHQTRKIDTNKQPIDLYDLFSSNQQYPRESRGRERETKEGDEMKFILSSREESQLKCKIR